MVKSFLRRYENLTIMKKRTFRWGCIARTANYTGRLPGDTFLRGWNPDCQDYPARRNNKNRKSID